MSSTQGSGYGFSQKAYDTVCTVYYDFVLLHNEHTQNALDRLTSLGHIKPHSRVLEVGCGPGKPITAFFASNGHDITAIDASNGMLDIARKNAPYAKFLQANMTAWEPSESGIEVPCYDVIVASHCLYTMSVSQVRSLLYKFTRWAKKEGIVIIGMSYNQRDLTRCSREFDERGWAEGITTDFLGYQFEDSSFGREDAWIDLIKSTGLEIVDVNRRVIYRADESVPDVQFYITAKKVQENSFFGPFPVPDMVDGRILSEFRDVDAWDELRGKLDTVKLKEIIVGAFAQGPNCGSVLSVAGQITPVIKGSIVEVQQISELPSPDVQLASFDGVLFGDGVLYAALSRGDYLDYAIQAIKPTGPAKIAIVECAPDNESVNMLKQAHKNDIPFGYHSGYLLQEAEKKCKAHGFDRVRYLNAGCTLEFGGALEGEERIAFAARLLSRVCTVNVDVRVELERRFKELLRVQFLFRPLGEIFSQMVVLVAERDAACAR